MHHQALQRIELAKAFNPADFEERIYQLWLDRKVFTPRSGEGEPFVIVIPPPNVTGVLHMGHGLNNSLQDILVRYHRMRGVPTLWVPGTDHAGIATQNVVERRLRQQGSSREAIGREGFLSETWKVKEEHHGIIVNQLKRIGASCDWDRERFTLDDGLSKAVREVFVSLYEKGLVYRGNYLVNRCCSCGTALSDDEVEYQEVQGKLYRYRYPIAHGNGFVEIATTRPETMLGDTAVAVNPEDPRHQQLVGSSVVLPLAEREIPVVADSYVDTEFGTGVVKITPAHDPNDYEVAARHDLPLLNILNPDGTLNENVPQRFQGLDVRAARTRVVEELKEQGLFVDEKDHVHQVGHCYRCNTVVEPYLSDQWFVRMKPLAEKALNAWKTGDVIFYPKRWENTYVRWLEGIRDWCISRQLWWGHRIPVWYCDDCGETIVSREDPDRCACGSTNLRQDEDVLDTWFSSWLWPFSTLGWPDQSEDLRSYYPTTALVTAYDIIFFWVARMIMAGMEFMGKPPFRDIYIHGLIRDKQGRKMSKSLGNGIDPLEVVDTYGADALKFTLAFLAAQGQDILLDMETFKVGSKFANKIWNASRYILMNLDGRNLVPIGSIEHNDVDRWILHRLNSAAGQVQEAIARYRFNDAAQAVYEYFWNDFCDWYIEASKLSLYSDDESEKDRAVSMLLAVLEESLRLAHPFLPFITEEIYQKLPGHQDSVAVTAYPQARTERENQPVHDAFEVLKELVRGVRTLRSEFTIPPERKIRVAVRASADLAPFFTAHNRLVALLMTASAVDVVEQVSDRGGSIPVVGTDYEAYVFVRDAIDVASEIGKLTKEVEREQKYLLSTERKLANKNFREKAPTEVVAKEEQKLAEVKTRIEKLQGYIRDLETS